jgi:hypothetical protein
MSQTITNVRIWQEEGEVLCCSSMCEADGGCPNIGKCRPVDITVQDKEE